MVKVPWWKEYPERDMEYVRWYPCALERVNPDDIWKKKEIAYYVHIPFCKSICTYCPFFKQVYNEKLAKKYVDHLLKEIKLYSNLPYIQDSMITAGYFGGGTPTSLKMEDLLRLIDFINDNFNIHPKAEISCEANIETVDEKYISTLLDIGINRLSFGVQSFNDKFLKILGRNHTAEEVFSMIKIAREVGCSNINIDLIYRLPGQTLSEWEDDLEKAIELEPDHISCYSLGLGPGTKLFEKELKGEIPQRPSIEIDMKMYLLAREKLLEAGYVQYTVVDFAKPGKECVHHKINWEAPQGEYIGMGAGAFSFINGWIFCNIHHLEDYITAISKGIYPVLLGKKLTAEEKMSRFMVLGVKCLRVSKEKFKETFGINVEDVYGEVLDRLEKYELITVDESWISLTVKGMLYVDNVSKSFYTKENYMKRQPRGVELAQLRVSL